MHVVSIESGAGKGGGHFDLAVYALFAQDGDFGFRAAVDKWSGDVFIHVKFHVGKQCAAFVVANQGKLAVGAGRVVAQFLDGMAGFLPCALQVGAWLVEQSFIVNCDYKTVGCRIDCANIMAGKFAYLARREASLVYKKFFLVKLLEYIISIFCTNL